MTRPPMLLFPSPPNAGGASATASSSIISTGNGAHPARVWTGENFVSSQALGGEIIKTVNLTGLPADAKELHGEWARITGLTKFEDGNFLQHPFFEKLPDELPKEWPKVTRDLFDQVQCYYAITTLIQHLESLGFDMNKAIATRKPIIAGVNAVSDFNAWFDPRATAGSNHLTFGNGKDSSYGEWHLGSDHDIARHELGHLILDCLNKALTGWFAGDGGAIHEGFGDAIAALLRNDPELSEDYVRATGKPYGADKGLRTVANDLKYNEVSHSVHSLGRVYGGFWWGVRTALVPIFKDERTAADLVMAFLVEHPTHYQTNKPGPNDFLDAATAGAKLYLEASGKYDVSMEKVKAIMSAEADKRGLRPPRKGDVSDPKTMGSELGMMLTSMRYPTVFLLESSGRGTFLGRDFHQQYLVLDGRHFVRMLGSGLIVFTDQEGNPNGYSDIDVRREVKVDPTINVKRQEALEKVREEARKQLERRERIIDKLNERRPSTEAEERARNLAVTSQEIRRKADEIAYNEALQQEDHRIAEPVLLPEEEGTDDLHWEYPFGPSSLFYVNARTGKVLTRKTPVL